MKVSSFDATLPFAAAPATRHVLVVESDVQTREMYADSTLAVPGQLTTIDWLPTWPARFTLVVIDAT